MSLVKYCYFGIWSECRESMLQDPNYKKSDQSGTSIQGSGTHLAATLPKVMDLKAALVWPNQKWTRSFQAYTCQLLVRRGGPDMAAAVPWFFFISTLALWLFCCRQPCELRLQRCEQRKRVQGGRKTVLGHVKPLCVLNWADGWALFCLMGWLRPSICPPSTSTRCWHAATRRLMKRAGLPIEDETRGCEGAIGSPAVRRHAAAAPHPASVRWNYGSKMCLFPRLARAQAAESSADFCHELTAAAASDWTSENWRAIMDRNGKTEE